MAVVVAGDVHLVESLCIVVVFFISGLTLKAGEAKAAFSEWRGIAYGMVAILGVTPLLGFAIRAVPLLPPEYTTGLTMMAAVPTTLGINLALARTARANVSLSTLLTVASNMIGTITTPLWLSALLPERGGVAPAGLRPGGVSIPNLLAKLAVSVLLPTVVGGAVRFVPRVAPAIDARKTPLSLLSTTALALIVWQSLSTARPFLVTGPPLSLLWVLLISLAMQVVYYSLNVAAVLLLRLPAREAAAVSITASQKSAPVAVAVIASVAASLESLGLMCVPAIICQLTQVFSNQPLAYAFRSWTRRADVASVANAPATSVVAGRRADVETGRK